MRKYLMHLKEKGKEILNKELKKKENKMKK